MKSFAVGGGTSHPSSIQEFGGHMPCIIRLSIRGIEDVTSVFNKRIRRDFRHYSPLRLTCLQGKVLDAIINSKVGECLECVAERSLRKPIGKDSLEENCIFSFPKWF